MRTLESWMLSYLLNSLWQIPLLYAAGWVAARALRSAGPAAEHHAWVGVLLLQTLLPACSSVQLPRALESLRAFLTWGSGGHRSGTAHVSVVMGAGSALGSFHLPSTLLMAITIAYGAVIAYFAARFLWRFRSLSVLRRNALEFALTGETSLYWEQCSERFGVRSVSIATSSRIFGPVTL